MGLFKSLAEAIGQPTQDERQAMTPELAAAVLLLAVERADFDKNPREREIIRRDLARHFQLAPGELEALLERAESETGEAVSFYEYVRQLNDSLDVQSKNEIFRTLWRVAYADGELDPYEEQLLRRLADMLYLPHKDFVRLKLEVVEA